MSRSLCPRKRNSVGEQVRYFYGYETWLNSTVTDLEIEILGYVSYRKGGGIGVYVSRNFKTEYLCDILRNTASGFQQLWLKIQVRHFEILYRLRDLIDRQILHCHVLIPT